MKLSKENTLRSLGSKRVVRRAAFTLMELLIVLMIVSVVAGVVGVNAARMLREQRFRTGVAAVADKLRLAQDLMLIHDTDVIVVLAIKDNRLEVALEVEKPLSTQAAKALKKKKNINSIRSVAFWDQRGQVHNEVVRLEFVSGGSKMSRGRLVLTDQPHGKRTANTSVIPLAGYPRLIEVGEQQLEDLDDVRSEELYPQEALQAAKTLSAA